MLIQIRPDPAGSCGNPARLGVVVANVHEHAERD